MKRHVFAGISVIVLLLVASSGAASFCLHVLACVAYLKCLRTRTDIVNTIVAGMLSLCVFLPFIVVISWPSAPAATVPSTITISMAFYNITRSMIDGLSKKANDDDVINL